MIGQWEYMDQLLPPTTKLGQGYVFTGMCDSVHRGGGEVSASVHAGIHPLGPGTPHGTRYNLPPQDQVHPPRPGTPPRPTPRGEIEGDQVQAYPKGGN